MDEALPIADEAFDNEVSIHKNPDRQWKLQAYLNNYR